MGVRRRGRENALQILYALDVSGVETGRFLRDFWEEHQAPAKVRAFAEEIVRGVVASRDALDTLIQRKSRNWTIPRMAKVDLNLLRIGAYELLHREDIPKSVTLNEAIEIAKAYGTEDSPAFVNGILDEIARDLPEKAAAGLAEELEEQELSKGEV